MQLWGQCIYCSLLYSGVRKGDEAVLTEVENNLSGLLDALLRHIHVPALNHTALSALGFCLRDAGFVRSARAAYCFHNAK